MTSTMTPPGADLAELDLAQLSTSDAAAMGCPHSAAALMNVHSAADTADPNLPTDPSHATDPNHPSHQNETNHPSHQNETNQSTPPIPALKPLPDDALERALAVSYADPSANSAGSRRTDPSAHRRTVSSAHQHTGQIAAPGGKTAILLVNHGSRSPVWRRLLLDVHAEVASRLTAIEGVAQVRTGFMEYTEPSIASQLKELDRAGMERVLVVPLLLTISDHSFDDIPAICGVSVDAEMPRKLAEENIEVYRAKAAVEFAPLLDFSGLVRTNLKRRLQTIVSATPPGQTTGLVLVGYGSAEYDDDWNRFFFTTRAHAEEDLPIAESAHAWCGHLVDYRKGPTLDAINAMLGRTDRVIVVPQLVSYDPMFQERIIGRAVRECDDPSRVLYSNDAILPEPAVGEWVVQISQQFLTA